MADIGYASITGGFVPQSASAPTPALIVALNNAADRANKTLAVAQELRVRLGVILAPEQPSAAKMTGGCVTGVQVRESSIRDRVESQARTVDEIAGVLSDILGRLEV